MDGEIHMICTKSSDSYFKITFLPFWMNRPF